VFAFALAAGFQDGVPNAARVRALMAAHAASGFDGDADAQAPHAAATVRRWVVIGRDAGAAPTWDPDQGLLFAGDVRLYNRPELIIDLGEPAAALQARSDLELARLAYRKWGHAAPSHLVGDFAFAAWDETERSLFAARDHLGVRPLYFRLLGDGVAVASDVGQLLALLPRPAADLCPEQILDGLMRRPTDVRRTYFRTIVRVPPGCAVAIAAGRVAETRYWTLPSAVEPPRSYAENCEQLRLIFRRAVRDRLESDRPLVAHASGGFDSSTIIMAADEIYRDEPGRPPLTMASAIAPGFPSDESYFMDAVGERVRFPGIRWRVVEESEPRFPGVARGAPILRRGLAGGPRRDLEIARESGARVLLSGVLGDGLWHATGVRRDMVRHGRFVQLAHDLARAGLTGARTRLVDAGLGVLPPATAVRIGERLLHPPGPPPEWMGPALRSIYARSLRSERRDLPATGWRSHLLYAVWARLTSPGAGRIVEAFVDYAAEEGVELRAPYADVRLTETVLRIPWQQREPRGHLRRTGRDALGPMLPPAFAKRVGQQGWTKVWAANAKRTALTIAPYIESGPWRSAEFVDRGIARSMLQGVLAGTGDDWPEAAILVTDFGALEAWLRPIFE
jgi:asparagine synthase (glutamine-hydrolysing)